MEPLRSEPRPVLGESAPTGLLLCRDLIFTSKITGTAAQLGYRVLVAGADSLARSLIETWQPRVVFVDLTAGEVAQPSALRSYQNLAGSDVWFVAFGSHVEPESLAAARAAGCQVVLPRSKFTAELPELMQRYFSRPAGRDC